MSFPRYPKYKDSGVAWLGEVPEHWAVLPCRAIVHERTAKNDGALCQDYLSLMANVGIIPYADKGDIGNKKPEDLTKCKIVTRGDFVINSMNYGIGSYGLSDYNGVCSPVYIVLKPQDEVVESRYAFRIFENKTFQTYAQSFGNGILEHRCAINWDILKSIGVGVPPKGEQLTILAFLDRETAKIDGLIAEQQRLIDLLKEKRQAVISHAVTKGLNPQAPMKPSGIEWLGDVPSHWRVMPMRMIAKVVRGASPRPAGDPRYFGGTDTPWVTVAEITKDNAIYLKETETFLTQEGATHSSLFQAGTLIYSNSGATLGVPKILRIDACANDGVVAFLNLDVQVNAEFLYHYLSSITEQIREKVKQGSGQPNLNTDIVKDLRFGVPPLVEQQSIVQRIAELVDKFGILTIEAERAISLLTERRTALISAAVTGQIDVRQLADATAA